jgi:hypothetical protein
MDFSSTSPTDRVYVSFSEHVDLHDYVRGYLASRKLVASEHARNAILECMSVFPGGAPYRKADMDFYLDRNLERKVGPLPPLAR